MRRRAFVAGLPLAGCAGVWRRAAPTTVGRPAVAAATVVQEAAVGGGRISRAPIEGPVVHVGLSLASGASEDGARAGLTSLAFASLVDRGLRDALGAYGATPVSDWGAGGGVLRCACEVEDLRDVVTVLARRVRAPELDAAGFAALSGRARAAEAILMGDPRRLAAWALDSLISTGEVASVRGAAVTAEELGRHVRRVVTPARMMWMSTGAAEIRPAIAAAWRGWTATEVARAEEAPEVAGRAAIVLLDRPGLDLAVIGAGRVGLAAGDADAVYAARMMRVLRSAVHERLRGERGLAYFTDAEHEEAAPRGRLRLVSQVDAAAAGEALGVVLRAFEQVRAMAISQAWMDDQDGYDELESAYAQTAGELRLAALARRHRLGLPLVPVRAGRRPVARLSAMIDAVARAEQWQILCVGDQRRVLAQLERFGPVVVRAVE